jgi:hypothetical protein
MALTSFVNRGEIINPTEGVHLLVQFYDLNGNPTDLTSFPQVSITSPNGNVILGPTSAGVYRQDTGLYGYDYTTALSAPLGVYTDTWRGIIPSSQVITKELQFIVYTTQAPSAYSTDGYIALGDDPGFHYSQVETRNINKILKAVKARLRSSGYASGVDQFGNQVYNNCDIFSIDTLVTMIAQGLSYFNSVPTFTFFTFCDTQIIDQFFDVFVEIAVSYAMASQALLERGLEWNLTDNGVSFVPPSLSELLNTESNYWGTAIKERVTAIKLSMKPSPLGIGSMWSWSGNSVAPAIKRLRHLRARQIL